MATPDAFMRFPRIETPRLILRQIVAADAPARYATFSDPHVMRYYGEEEHASVEESREHIAAVDGWYARREGIRWGITPREGPATGEVIGSCGFFRFEDDFQRAEMGYELRRAFWRQGIMREALTAILDYGFQTMGLRRVEAVVMEGNEPSAALLRSLGFTQEGTLRQRAAFHGRFWDEWYFGLLREEWTAR